MSTPTWFDELCSTTFMPHGQCYLWNPDLLRLHAVSDSLITLAYFSIPVALIYFVRKRRDLPYPAMFLLFGAFIVACGTTHLLEVVTIWHPYYWLTGGVKAATAAISLISAVCLVRVVPDALALPGPEELRRLNASLEENVRARTADLSRANEELRREIVQRKEAEQEVQRLNVSLQQRLAEMETLVEILPVGVGIATDATGRDIRANRAFARMLGVPADANTSLRPPEGQTPPDFRVLHAGRELRVDELPIYRALHENQPVLDFEETIVRPDGRETIVLANAVPLTDGRGGCRGCVATFQDITVIRHEIAQREQAETRHRAMFNSALDAIVTMDAQGLIVGLNPAAERTFGYTSAEALNREMAELMIPEKLRGRHRAGLARVVAANLHASHILGQRIEIEALHAAGHEFPIELAIVRIQEDPPLFTGFIRDLTERRQAEAQRLRIERKLQDTQKLESLGVLAGGIAHDFNNLLTGILGNASLARLELPPTSSMRPALERIEESAHRAADLCRQMLAYSGRGRFVVQEVDLNRLVEDTTHLLRISISKVCVLRFNLAPALPAIRADVTQMRQIVMNLVINASEAIGDRSGVIALATGVVRADADYLATLVHADGVVPGDYVFLEVSDTGCGMDAATLGRIFDPFFTTKFTGRGLGLAAVIGIIRGHQGALKVYSEPGRGSTFKILLPRAGDAVAPAGPPAPARDTAWRGQGTVLVVDDEETIRTVSAIILESLGFSVVLANDGREALEKYRAEPARYVLVLLDLTMPHMDGEETFRQLRHLNPGVKVVLMSGFNQQEAVSRFTGKGLAGFVQKPFSADGITAAVRDVLLRS